jgi:hypothetical protein
VISSFKKQLFFLSSKNMKINMDIVNDVSYKRAKFHYEILYILTYTKITNLIKFVDLKIYALRSRHLSFVCSQKYNRREHDFLHVLLDK